MEDDNDDHADDDNDAWFVGSCNILQAVCQISVLSRAARQV